VGFCAATAAALLLALPPGWIADTLTTQVPAVDGLTCGRQW